MSKRIHDFPPYQAFVPEMGINLPQPVGHVVVHRNNEIEPREINEADIPGRMIAGINVEKILKCKDCIFGILFRARTNARGGCIELSTEFFSGQVLGHHAPAGIASADEKHSLFTILRRIRTFFYHALRTYTSTGKADHADHEIETPEFVTPQVGVVVEFYICNRLIVVGVIGIEGNVPELLLILPYDG